MAHRVFLIDDIEATRSLMRLLLLESSYQVVGEAGTLLTALQKLTVTQTDIVVLDLQMPDGNGLQAIPRIKEIDPTIVIVIASANNEATTVQSAFRAGGHGYLIKPFAAQALLRTLGYALRKARPRSGPSN